MHASPRRAAAWAELQVALQVSAVMLLQSAAHTAHAHTYCMYICADFLNDFWELRHELTKDPSTIFHHVAAISLVAVSQALLPASLDWAVPYFYIIEASTVCLSTKWLLQTFGMKETKVCRARVTTVQCTRVCTFILLKYVHI